MCYVLPFIKWIFAYQNVHTLNCSTGLFSKVTLGRVPKDPELMKQHFYGRCSSLTTSQYVL